MKQTVMVAINVGSIQKNKHFLESHSSHKARKPFGINFLSTSSSSIF